MAVILPDPTSCSCLDAPKTKSLRGITETLLEPNDRRFPEDGEKADVLENARGFTVGAVAGNPNLNPTPVSVGNMVESSPSDPKTSASYACSC